MPDEKKPSSATLTLKPRAAAKDEDAAPRQRSGSRARRVEQMARQQGVEPPNPAAAEHAPATETQGRPARSHSDAGSGPADRRPASPRPAGARPGGAERAPRSERPPRSDRSDRQHPHGRSASESSRARPAGGLRSERSAADGPRRERFPNEGRRSDSPRSDSPRRPGPRGEAPRPAAPARTDSPRAAHERRARPVTRDIVGHETVLQVFVPCPQGLEAALADELQALGFTAQATRAGCHLSADWPGIRRINLFSRLATRVLVKVSSAPVQTEDDILELARATPWERWFGPEHSLRVDTSAVRSPMKSLQYCNLRAKDGICDRLREREGARPDIDTVRPDARVHLFLDERSATLYLDTSGESLFKRGWRLDKGEAPIRENLAAGLLALSGWQPDQALLDPFCGSGTILIEAAWKAMGMPPGIMRPFAFERLRHHDRQAWYAYKDQVRSQARQTELLAPIVGVDLDPANIVAARANASRAGLGSGQIQFQAGDACDVPPPAPTGWIVTNPPYGERLANDDLELWPRWASHLKRHYSGWQVHAISNDLQLPQHMRLQARRRHPLHNGALDCRLFSFDMVAERYEG